MVSPPKFAPHTASRVWDLQEYSWLDHPWMANRAENNSLNSPISIYEIHLGSWRRVPEEGNRWLTYREMAPLLADYVHDAGFTHVEFLPIMEHPFDGSWGYQIIGYFAPTSRFGTPSDFMYLIDYLHQHGIGVILDWVPAHFPKDEAGLGYFDGSHLYEHADPRQAEQPDWNTFVFNYGRNEVQKLFWSAMLCSGSTSITSTVFASMRSPRCCISITGGAKGNGYRTVMAARKISKRFIS
jgi:1,4-alpha-glucan branching enzyme